MFGRVAVPTQIGRSFADFEKAIGAHMAVPAAT
jgi:hypothetical protein